MFLLIILPSSYYKEVCGPCRMMLLHRASKAALCHSPLPINSLALSIKAGQWDLLLNTLVENHMVHLSCLALYLLCISTSWILTPRKRIMCGNKETEAPPLPEGLLAMIGCESRCYFLRYPWSSNDVSPILIQAALLKLSRSHTKALREGRELLGRRKGCEKESNGVKITKVHYIVYETASEWRFKEVAGLERWLIVKSTCCFSGRLEFGS